MVETVDGNTAELEQLQSELALLSDKLGAIDAKRSKASLRLITPREGCIWYINHVLIIITIIKNKNNII